MVYDMLELLATIALILLIIFLVGAIADRSEMQIIDFCDKINQTTINDLHWFNGFAVNCSVVE